MISYQGTRRPDNERHELELIEGLKESLKEVWKLKNFKSISWAERKGQDVPYADTNLTTAVAGKDGFALASAATAVVEFKAKWLNLY